jgi:hypothetical protein
MGVDSHALRLSSAKAPCGCGNGTRLRVGRSINVIRRERVHECARGDMGGM